MSYLLGYLKNEITGEIHYTEIDHDFIVCQMCDGWDIELMIIVLSELDYSEEYTLGVELEEDDSACPLVREEGEYDSVSLYIAVSDVEEIILSKLREDYEHKKTIIGPYNENSKCPYCNSNNINHIRTYTNDDELLNCGNCRKYFVALID